MELICIYLCFSRLNMNVEMLLLFLYLRPVIDIRVENERGKGM
jgi:hypothetical protein